MKATSVSVRLRIFLFAFKIPNSHAVKVNIMCAPSIDLCCFYPQKYAHIYSMLLLFLEVPPTYIHTLCILCCFYPRNMHLCCCHLGSTHSSIHMHPLHTLRKCSTPTLAVNTKNICCHPIIFLSSNKALALVDTPY